MGNGFSYNNGYFPFQSLVIAGGVQNSTTDFEFVFPLEKLVKAFWCSQSFDFAISVGGAQTGTNSDGSDPVTQTWSASGTGTVDCTYGGIETVDGDDVPSFPTSNYIVPQTRSICMNYYFEDGEITFFGTAGTATQYQQYIGSFPAGILSTYAQSYGFYLERQDSIGTPIPMSALISVANECEISPPQTPLPSSFSGNGFVYFNFFNATDGTIGPVINYNPESGVWSVSAGIIFDELNYDDTFPSLAGFGLMDEGTDSGDEYPFYTDIYPTITIDGYTSTSTKPLVCAYGSEEYVTTSCSGSVSFNFNNFITDF